MPGQRAKTTAGRSGLAVLTLLVSLHCGPQFPPSWLIPAEPTDAGGVVDSAGKLRVLAMAAEPPEAAPGATVSAAALIVTHPRFGEAADLDGSGRLVGSPVPRGLSLQWRLCRLLDDSLAPLPCGMVDASRTVEERELPAQPGAATQLVVPVGGVLPQTLVLTLIAADAAFPGGAAACHDQAVVGGGVSPDAAHCVIAVKRIKVATGSEPNHNPQLAGIYMGPEDASPAELGSQAGSYPLLDARVQDDQRPQLLLTAERRADAVESEPDPQRSGSVRPENLSAAFFTTAGTLEAGRGSFLDLGCAAEPAQCPAPARSAVHWQPPAGRAAVEAPDGVVFFFVVLRDDRGGVGFRRGYALAR